MRKCVRDVMCDVLKWVAIAFGYFVFFRFPFVLSRLFVMRVLDMFYSIIHLISKSASCFSKVANIFSHSIICTINQFHWWNGNYFFTSLLDAAIMVKLTAFLSVLFLVFSLFVTTLAMNFISSTEIWFIESFFLIKIFFIIFASSFIYS